MTNGDMVVRYKGSALQILQKVRDEEELLF